MADKMSNNRRMSEFPSRPLTRTSLRLSFRRNQNRFPADQDDHQAKFYQHYHKVAEEYDREFFKKHEEDLNTTLIFVSGST